MKKVLSLLVIAVLLASFSSCNRNMRRDVKRLVHKTERCFSMVDGNNTVTDEDTAAFNECYNEMMTLMEENQNNYSDPVSARKFDEMFKEEIHKSNLSPNVIEVFDQVYALGNDE